VPETVPEATGWQDRLSVGPDLSETSVTPPVTPAPQPVLV
jgi:hypothetical protein